VSDRHDPAPLPDGLDLPAADWQQTPQSVRLLVLTLLKRLEALEARVPQNSSNSSRPPSTDAPPTKRPRRMPAAERRTPGGKPGPPGPQQMLRAPRATVALFPEVCSCGPAGFADLRPYHTHQGIELPVMRPDVTHWLLHQGRGLSCGNVCQAPLPSEQESGYGPRLTGCIGEMAGIVGASRSAGHDLCASVFGIPLSTGALQKMVDRVSTAIMPHDDTIGQVARTAAVHYMDETSWFVHGDRHWLWGMAPPAVAYCHMHSTRSKTACVQLIAGGRGILVRDGYLVYQHGQGLRQSGLAPLVRTAKGLAEHLDGGIAPFGHRVHTELQRRWHMETERPPVGQWRAWYARFRSLITRHAGRGDKAGTLARRLQREGDALWVFLDGPGVEGTNNGAERAHRFGVLWRKRSQGTCGEKGNRWVERVLSLRHTCRIRGRPTFPRLVEAVSCLFTGETPELTWMTHHESLPACSTP
jgi:transposase